jgi:hypothetical protein
MSGGGGSWVVEPRRRSRRTRQARSRLATARVASLTASTAKRVLGPGSCGVGRTKSALATAAPVAAAVTATSASPHRLPIAQTYCAAEKRTTPSVSSWTTRPSSSSRST